MPRIYRVRDFARLAGITPKTLRHYERLGLLTPARSAAGYRLYTEAHLERLEHILALKFVGLPLKDIRMALARTPKELSLALAMQHRALQEKQAHVARALRAIEVARRALEERTADAPSVLKNIIEVIRMQDAVEAMKRYYRSAEEWEKQRRYCEEGPAPEWRALYRDAANHLGEDPGSESVQALADRWLALTLRAAAGDRALQQDSWSAWNDREHWPEPMKARLAEFKLEEVWN